MDEYSGLTKFTAYLSPEEGYSVDNNPVELNIGNTSGSEFLMNVAVPFVLESPELSVGGSSVTYFDYTTSSYPSSSPASIQSISLRWDPVENASGYKIFFIENAEDVMAYTTIIDGIYLSPSNTPLFTNETLLLTDTLYTYSYKYPSTVTTLYAFVFAYSENLQSLLPTTVFRCIISDYELTTASSRYLDKDGEIIRNIDNERSDGAGDILTINSALIRYPYTMVVIPDKTMFTARAYEYTNFTFEYGIETLLTIVGETITLDSVESIEFTLGSGVLNGINDGAIEVIESPVGVYKIYLTEAQKNSNELIKLKFSEETNIFPSLVIRLRIE